MASEVSIQKKDGLITASNRKLVKASLKNKEFLSMSKQAKKGDVLEIDDAELELVEDFTDMVGIYENRISPTVIIRKEFEDGKLFRKHGSNVLVFVPTEKLK